MATLHSPQPGVALILSLLMLAAVVTGTLTVSALVLSELHSSNITDQGAVSFYAAESGLEQGLYLVRQEHAGVSDSTGDQVDVPQASAVSLSNGAIWWRDARATQSELITSIAKDHVVQLDLFDPNNSLGNQQLDHLTLKRDGTATGPEWLEVDVSGWTGTSLNFSVTRSYFASTNLNTGVTVPLTSQVNYRITLRALYADIHNLHVKAYKNPSENSNTIYPLPSRITVTATSQFGDTQRALSVTVPQQVPQASVFDYTLFSDQSICKATDSFTPCLP